MDLSLVTIVINIMLMGLLAAVIFYARRLSESISVFRNSRKEMDSMIRSLSANVDKADAAIKSIRRETDTSADDLHFMINKARALSEELQFIQETGERLAERLEQAHKSNRTSVKDEHPKEGPATSKKDNATQKKKASPPRPLFNIIDKEYDAGSNNDTTDRYMMEDDLDMPDNLKSQAERDLAKALQRRQKK